MTESDLIDLGFTKIEYTKKDLEELGDSSDPYRYYTFEIFPNIIVFLLVFRVLPCFFLVFRSVP